MSGAGQCLAEDNNYLAGDNNYVEDLTTSTYMCRFGGP